MIAVRLMGGLGNQMFQYAIARSLAIKNHTKPVMDMVFFDNIAEVDTPREYELNCFNIKEAFLSKAKRPLENPEANYQGKKGTLRKIKHSLLGKAWSIHREPHHNFDKNTLKKGDNTYLVGYWQTEKYFTDIRTELLKDFSFKTNPNTRNQKVLEQIKSTPSISLHVRRGDYISNNHANKFHGTKGSDYYTKALKEIIKKKPDNYTIFIFSDDIAWCKKNLKLANPTVYVTGNKKGSEDMRLMMNCTHNIIANSSFSWWAAWLNQNSNKIVVGPKLWFNDSSVNTNDVLPSSWIKI